MAGDQSACLPIHLLRPAEPSNRLDRGRLAFLPGPLTPDRGAPVHHIDNGQFYRKLDDLHYLENYRHNGAEKRRLRLELARMRGDHTLLEWAEMIVEFSGRCLRCGDTASHKDHIIPLYQGGCDCIHNIQPLCRFCNLSKGPDRTDWKQFRRMLHDSV